MALIKCPECGRQVSDKARACPGCGCPVADETSEDEILNTKSTDAPDSTKIMSSSQNNGSAICLLKLMLKQFSEKIKKRKQTNKYIL